MAGPTNAVWVVLVGLCLVAAVLVDSAVQPRTYFVSSPFAISILVATYRLSPRGIAITAFLATGVAIVAAFVDRAPAVPATFALLGLVFLGFLATLLGVQRRVAVERAQESEEARQQVTSVLNSITDAFATLDRGWRITYLNAQARQAYERLYRGGTADLIGRNVWEAIPQLVGTETDREFHRAVTEQTTVAFETYFTPLDRWFDVRAYPSASGLTIYFRDVTDRKRAEAEREEYLARERALAEIADALVRERELSGVVDVIIALSLRVHGADAVGIWQADARRRDLTLLAYRGKSPETADLLQHLTFDAPSVTARAARDERTQVIEDVKTAEAELSLLRRVVAAEHVRSVLATPLIARGHVVGVATYGWGRLRHFTARDLELDATIADLFAVAIENARLNDEIREALHLREEFMAAAAHELRTPVTVIKGRTQMLLKTDAEDTRVRTSLESVDRHADRIALLIDDILAAAYLRPGVPNLSRARFDVGVLTQQTVDTIARTAENHQFRTEIADSLVVDADASLTRQVISRLLENALRYSPDGGLVETAAHRQGDEAVVSVTDHGVGIGPERQAHVFEPFYELVPPGVPGYVGIVSLGLYLSKRIAEAQGGRIWFTSAPGQGSTFSFSLPLSRP